MDAITNPKWVKRSKQTQIDGTEHEAARINEYNLNVDQLEAIGHEALRVATAWRKEIAERIPTPPTHKVFTFSNCYGGDKKIATWVERPWALVRVGKGTSVAFLVKEQGRPLGSYCAWIVSAKTDADGGLRWKCRFGTPTTVDQRDLIQVFPYSLPDSPTSGDLEYARAKARATA